MHAKARYLVGIVSLAACGSKGLNVDSGVSSGRDSTTDPLAAKCMQACNIDDTHPCYDKGKGEQTCVDMCRALTHGVDKDPTYLDGCAECLAEQFRYALKSAPCSATSGGPDCCYDGYVISPSVGDPNSLGWTACLATCLRPDGGAG
jgi:hypothetical protein